MTPISGIGSISSIGMSPTVGANAAGESGFGEMLSGALQSVSDTERAADDLVTALAAGEDVQLSDVAIASTEAALAAREYAYDTLGWKTAISLVAPENAGSRNVAKRMGATFEGTFDHERHGTLEIWRHPSPQDLAAGGMEAYA